MASHHAKCIMNMISFSPSNNPKTQVSLLQFTDGETGI